ncbi:MAG TPA: hypothetical protein VK043_07890 [Burkholderiales bacterium]|nr:hypothetical protein [Burkholderiales bacterium]
MSVFLAAAFVASAALASSVQARDPAPSPKGDRSSSAGASRLVPTGPQDAYLERKRAEDERRATERKEKMKERPGYEENVSSPRA